MVSYSSDAPIRLSDYRFSTADVCRISGIGDMQLRNWISRKILPPIGKRFAGRLMYSLIDTLRVSAMHDLVSRVSMPPAVAVKVAELIVREVVARAPDGIADVNSVPRSLILALTWVDGEPCIAFLDKDAPNANIYSPYEGEWSLAHVVLPLSGLLQRVLWEALAVLASQQGAAA
jgi:hypothetical protein